MARPSSSKGGRERSRGRSGTVRRGARARAGTGKKGFILTITEGRNAGREYFFEQDASLGRTDENNVIIIDPGVSRRHAHISGGEGIFTIEDLGSSNGTRLNGERLETPEVLRDGDYLQIGETTLLFSVLDVAHEEVTSRTSFAELEEALADRQYTDQKDLWRLRMRRLVRSRRTHIVLLVALVLGAGLGGYAIIRSGKTGIVIDRSDEVVPYSDEDTFFNRVYGYGPYDRTHRDQVQVEFEYLGGRVTLQYGAWGIDKVGEVQIKVGKTKVGEIPLTMKRWVYGLKVVPDRALFQKGKRSVVVFDNTLNPPGKEAWEICYVQIIQEAIPPANRAEARFQFDLGKKAFEDREIAPGNLYDALGKFKRARDLLEELPEKPEIYAEALASIDKTDKLLTKRFQDALFASRRAERFQGRDAARRVLRRALNFFGREDFRYREVKRQLDAMAPR